MLLRVKDLSITYGKETKKSNKKGKPGGFSNILNADIGNAITGNAVTVNAVDGATFSLEAGHRLGLVGESGSGKSTIALSLMGAISGGARVTSGEIIFDGVDLLRLSEKARRRYWWRRIVYIPQNSINSLNPFYTVEKQLAETLAIHSEVKNMKRERGKAALRRRVAKLLEQVKLDRDVAGMYSHQLSGGMRQRVMLAMGLVGNPELIILDEPTTALDVKTESEVLDAVRDVRERLGCALIVITHDLKLVERHTDKIVVLNGGRVVEKGPTDSVLAGPLHPYTKKLIDSYPKGKIDINALKLASKMPPAMLLHESAPGGLKDPESFVGSDGCVYRARCAVGCRKGRDSSPELTLVDSDRFVACHGIERCAEHELQ